MARRCSSLWLLLQVLGHVLLVVNQAGSSPDDKTIHIGYLLHEYMDTPGAINVAIQQAQNDGLLHDYSFRYNHYVLTLFDRSTPFGLRCVRISYSQKLRFVSESELSDSTNDWLNIILKLLIQVAQFKKARVNGGLTMTLLRIPTKVSTAADRPASYDNQTICFTRPAAKYRSRRWM